MERKGEYVRVEITLIELCFGLRWSVDTLQRREIQNKEISRDEM